MIIKDFDGERNASRNSAQSSEAAGQPVDSADSPPRTNLLIHEQSPYLLQHATNPVNWHPWGEEAFRAAREQDKLIVLSIGYSTCHWCHVMERESFCDAEVAGCLNRDYISIKVDREERPDIDMVYMELTQTLTGHGGWPNTVILTPEGEPFFAGTYFPRTTRMGMPGLLDLLPDLANAWRAQKSRVRETASQIAKVLSPARLRETSQFPLGKETLEKAGRQLAAAYDSHHGGFGGAPKFPTPHQLTFLLRHWHDRHDREALQMATHTLRQMHRGGICDHLGFGFHRYATDAAWHTPHFEKMLYDQALLAMAYLEAYQATQDPEFAQVAHEIFSYVLRDMTDADGGFYSAEDADSEGEEGKFYVWTRREIQDALPGAQAALFLRLYAEPSISEFRVGDAAARQEWIIPHLNCSFSDWAKELGLSEAYLQAQLAEIRLGLLCFRQKRVRPGRDDKILADWNGLMIAALALGGAVLDEPAYLKAAEQAVGFVFEKLKTADGLLHRYRQGQAGLPGYLDDYAFLIWGLLNLHEASFETRHLRWALLLMEEATCKFWDEKNGGFYFTSSDASWPAERRKEVQDGALPSGNSVMALNLLRLGRLTGNAELEKRADLLFKAFSVDASLYPGAHLQLMNALSFALGHSCEVVIVGLPESPDTQQMLAALRQRFLPHSVVLFKPDGQPEPEIVQLAGFTRRHLSLQGRATAYVCRNHSCLAPTGDIEEMMRAIEGNQ